jgi:Flp pilus assembly protein TadD
LKLGLCLAALSRVDEARSELRETLRLDPGNMPAQRSLSRLAHTKPVT